MKWLSKSNFFKIIIKYSKIVHQKVAFKTKINDSFESIKSYVALMLHKFSKKRITLVATFKGVNFEIVLYLFVVFYKHKSFCLHSNKKLVSAYNQDF